VSRIVLVVRFLSPVTTCFNDKLLRGSRGVQPHPLRKECKSVREKIEKEEERVRKRLCERVGSKKIYRVCGMVVPCVCALGSPSRPPWKEERKLFFLFIFCPKRTLIVCCVAHKFGRFWPSDRGEILKSPKRTAGFLVKSHAGSWRTDFRTTFPKLFS